MEEHGKLQKNQVQTVFEAMRIQTFHLINIQLSRKDKIRDIEKFMPFDWDKERKSVGKKQTVEEMKAILTMVARVQNKKCKK